MIFTDKKGTRASTGRQDLAEQHANTAIQVAPQKPTGYDFLAVVAQEKGDVAAGLAASKQAIERGSNEAWTYYLSGAALQRQAIALGGVPANEARTIADLYEKAIDINPNLKTLYIELGRVLSGVAKAKDTDDDYLALGRKNFPGEGLIFVEAAQLANLRGKRQEAQDLMSSALARRQSLSANDAETINHIRYEWLSTEYNETIQKDVDHGRFEDAMQLFDQAAKEDMPRDIHTAMETYRRSLYPLMKIREADEMMASGDRAAARKRYEEALAMPSIAPMLKRQLEGFLEKLKAQLPDLAAGGSSEAPER